MTDKDLDKQMENNTKEENGMIINESKNTFMPKDEKELRYLEKMADEAMEEIKAGKCKPYKELKWFR
jgi:hypothetical protein